MKSIVKDKRTNNQKSWDIEGASQIIRDYKLNNEVNLKKKQKNQNYEVTYEIKKAKIAQSLQTLLTNFSLTNLLSWIFGRERYNHQHTRT